MTKQNDYNFFSSLPEQTRQKIKVRMTRITLFNGDSAYRRNEEADALYQVVSGKIKISNVSKDGKEILYVVFGEGDCFGEVGLLDHKPRAHNAISSGTTVLSVLKKNDFDVLIEEHPEIIKSLALVLCANLHTVWDFFESRTLLPLQQRLAQRISDLTASHEKEPKKEFVQDINLSQIDLANMMGASRQAIGKILKGWEDQSFISIHYGKMTIINLDAIEKIAQQP